MRVKNAMKKTCPKKSHNMDRKMELPPFTAAAPQFYRIQLLLELDFESVISAVIMTVPFDIGPLGKTERPINVFW